jgi:uncharacterized protein YbbK (DUF523 family)
LLGSPVRYNGAHKRSSSAVLLRWLKEGRVVPVCPEIAGGLAVPRPPAEIVAGVGGTAVLARLARVVDPSANDLSAAFIAGAQHALGQVHARGIRIAVLKEGSPSCGSDQIHDGTFSGRRVHGQGVTTALLSNAGVRVFSEEQFEQASEFLRLLEAGKAAE